MKKLITSLVAILSLTAILAGCADQGSSTTAAGIKTIKVGVIVPLSGPAGAIGEQQRNVYEYALNEANSRIAPKGYKLELDFEDGKCTGTDAATAFQKLTDVDGVKFILGGLCSSETLGFLPLLADKNVMAFSSTNSNPELEGKSSLYHSISYSDDLIGKGVADQLGKYKKIAILTEQNDYNQAMRRVVESALQAKYPNAQIVADEQFPKGGDDFRNLLQKIKASNPDVLFLNPNAGSTAEALVKQLAELKDWKVDKVSIFTLMGGSVLSISPETLENTVIVDVPKINDQKFLDTMNEIVKAKGTLDDLGNYYTAATIDLVNITADLITATDADPAKANDMLGNDVFSGNIGQIKFDGHSFVEGIPTQKYVIKGGKVLPFNN